ncbi:low affinity iron permease family protein [Roseibacterium beibuensis]|uniref:low affinity iron permease family protein n=1 Tax=[Roseibacterium] beibuensis TaxID=1193142 RepID=UPI00217D1CE8|nr:low affinity iron permease family protein [Roseibacterium beibuensis]MCS6627114.1 low affinity iron permease family protein [Roseibacterium beibuensis]
MEKFFLRFANHTARLAGKPWTFLVCLGVVVVWAVTGPIFRFSSDWQLVINTGTTIVTFLMVFLIQNTQNRDGAALQAKLDELIHAVGRADERFVGIERLSEKELDGILERVEARARKVRKEGPPVVATRKQDAEREQGSKRRGKVGA